MVSNKPRTMRNAIKHSIASSFILIAAQAFIVLDVGAQESSPASSTGGLEEIIVTARKTSESLVEVPISITAVSGATLDQMNVRDLTDAAEFVPNLYIDHDPAGQRIAIRGMGNPASAGVIDSSVGLAVDGVFYGRPRWLDSALFDVADLEVLRGPQSTYFGKNTTAGLVNIATRGPGSQWEEYVQGGYEALIGGYNFEGAVGGPISDVLGVRIAYRQTHSDGYITQTVGNSETTPAAQLTGPEKLPVTTNDVGRITFEFKPSDVVKLTYKFTLLRETETAGPEEIGACDTAFRAALISEGNPDDCVVNDRQGPRITYFPGGVLPRGLFTNNDGGASVLGADIQLGSLTLTSTTGYTDLKSEWNASGSQSTVPVFIVYRPERNQDLSEELRLASAPDKPISFVTGVSWDYTAFRINSDLDIPSFDSQVRQLNEASRSYAAFGEVTAKPTDGLSIAIGGRFTADRRLGRLTQDSGLFGTDLQVKYPGADFSYPGSISENNFSPDVTIRYKFDPNTQVYATFRRAFKEGGFDLDLTGAQAANGGFSYGPETAKSFEIGAKSELFDRRLLLTAAVFDTDYTGLQLDSYTGANPNSLTLNAGAARNKGGEFEALWRPVGSLTFDLSLGYTDSRYTSFHDAPCTVGQIAAGVCVTNPVSGAATQDLTGHSLPLSPKFSGAIGGNYTYHATRSYDVLLAADASYRSSVITGVEQDPYERSGALALLNARIGIEPEDGRGPYAAVVGRNVLNRLYYTGATALPYPNSWTYEVAPPATVEFDVGYRFR